MRKKTFPVRKFSLPTFDKNAQSLDDNFNLNSGTFFAPSSDKEKKLEQNITLFNVTE